MKHRILFLDFDGVLNNRPFLNCPRRERDNLDFDPANIAQLNNLLQRSHARIVVSSSWRGRRAFEMRELLARNGVCLDGHVPVIGVTPRLAPGIRGNEIAEWMRCRRVPEQQVVILDDDDDMGDLGSRLVRTNFEYGLTTHEVSAALRLW